MRAQGVALRGAHDLEAKQRFARQRKAKVDARRTAGRRVFDKRFDDLGIADDPVLRERYLKQLIKAGIAASVAREFGGRPVALFGVDTAPMRDHGDWPGDALDEDLPPAATESEVGREMFRTTRDGADIDLYVPGFGQDEARYMLLSKWAVRDVGRRGGFGGLASYRVHHVRAEKGHTVAIFDVTIKGERKPFFSVEVDLKSPRQMAALEATLGTDAFERARHSLSPIDIDGYTTFPWDVVRGEQMLADMATLATNPPTPGDKLDGPWFRIKDAAPLHYMAQTGTFEGDLLWYAMVNNKHYKGGPQPDLTKYQVHGLRTERQPGQGPYKENGERRVDLQTWREEYAKLKDQHPQLKGYPDIVKIMTKTEDVIRGMMTAGPGAVYRNGRWWTAQERGDAPKVHPEVARLRRVAAGLEPAAALAPASARSGKTVTQGSPRGQDRQSAAAQTRDASSREGQASGKRRARGMGL